MMDRLLPYIQRKRGNEKLGLVRIAELSTDTSLNDMIAQPLYTEHRLKLQFNSTATLPSNASMFEIEQAERRMAQGVVDHLYGELAGDLSKLQYEMHTAGIHYMAPELTNALNDVIKKIHISEVSHVTD